MPTIQITRINGGIIENAKWEVNTLENVQIGHQIQISLNMQDSELLSYVIKRSNIDCVAEKNPDGKFSIIATCLVKAFRHMLDAHKLDSMAILIPINRAVENVILYALNRDQCDPRFINLLHPADTTSKSD